MQLLQTEDTRKTHSWENPVHQCYCLASRRRCIFDTVLAW